MTIPRPTGDAVSGRGVPLPLSLGARMKSGWYDILGPQGRIIAKAASPDEANAIIRAVNSRETFISALRAAQQAMHWYKWNDHEQIRDRDCMEARTSDEIDTALKLVEES